MKPLNKKNKAKLLIQIATDLKSVTRMSDALAKNACKHLNVGRQDEALNALLDIEPRIHDAKKLFLLATYVNDLGNYGDG